MASRHAPLHPEGIQGQITLWLRRALGAAQILQQLRDIREQQEQIAAEVAAITTHLNVGQPNQPDTSNEQRGR